MISEDLKNFERPTGVLLKRRHRFKALLTVMALFIACIASIPSANADIRVTVRAGDILSLIALEYGVSTQSIMNANGISNPDLLFMGQELIIPGVSQTVSTTSVIVTVEWGDSLSAIAEDYGVSVASLMEANGITNANSIFAGQELKVPGVSGPLQPAGPVLVTVVSGDTLSEIASKYGVGLSVLMNENGITKPDAIYIGQKIRIPGTGVAPATTLPPIRISVKSGDTLSVIADTYGVKVSSIVAANGLSNANYLSVGQELIIPGVYGTAASPQYSTNYGAVVVDGRGWGHGRGMGQYGSLGYAIDEGWGRDQILNHYYGGTTAGTVSNEEIGVRLLSHDGKPTTVYVESALLAVGGEAGNWTQLNGKAVKVTLEGDSDRYRVATGQSCSGPFTNTGIVISSPIVRIRAAHMAPPGATTTTTTTTTTTLPVGASTTLPTTTIAPTTTTTLPTTTVPQPGSVFQVLDTTDADLDWTLQVCEGSNKASWYRGEIRAARAGGNQRTVNWLPIEEYLRSVVPREMPPEWADMGGGAGIAALEVQSVAARSYALAEKRYAYAKTCDTIRCQVYEGRRSRSGNTSWSNEDSRSDTAIRNTAGMVRYQDGEIARTEFSASTGGHTITADFPGVPDAGDDVSINPVHKWTKEITVNDVISRFGLTPLYEIEVITRDGFGDDGGRAEEIEFRARDGQRFVITGNRFRREFGLKSNWYGVNYGPPEAATQFPEERLDEYRVTTGYTEEEWQSLLDSADHLKMTPNEFQHSAVWVVAFLLNLSPSESGPTPLAEPPLIDGVHNVETAYKAAVEDQKALEQIAEVFAINGGQAQKAAVTILVFLVQIAKAAGR